MRRPVATDNAPMETEPLKADPANRKRRWFQFSLRTLLLTVTACAIWVGWYANRVHRQKIAVQAVLDLGGTVFYDYQSVDDRRGRFVYDPKAEPAWPHWIVRAFGVDSVQNVVNVAIMNGRATDETLRLIGQVPSIKVITLKGGNVTNTGVAYLCELPNLQALGLWQTHVGDGGLQCLAPHKHLKNLVLDETNVTDQDLVYLRDMTDMEEWLGLTDNPITDRGLENLVGMKKLRSLNLLRTKATAAGVSKLQAELPNTRISF
jgi:hypothetical protein